MGSRTPLSRLGLLPAREPPSVAFCSYKESEAEGILLQRLSREDSLHAKELSRSLVQFAMPSLGRDIRLLFEVGCELLQSKSFKNDASPAHYQRCIAEAVRKRIGLCDLSGFVSNSQVTDTTNVPIMVAMRTMTDTEKRLLLAVYLAAHINKDHDSRLFLPLQGRKGRRKQGVSKTGPEMDLPTQQRTPRVTTLSRTLAIYHCLAGSGDGPNLISYLLFRHLARLREVGFLRYPVDRVKIESEVSIVCLVESTWAQACAHDLNIDFAEYLAEFQ